MNFAETADRYAPKAEDIIGPYSPWPPRRRRRQTRAVASASSMTTAGFLVHSGLPLDF